MSATQVPGVPAAPANAVVSGGNQPQAPVAPPAPPVAPEPAPAAPAAPATPAQPATPPEQPKPQVPQVPVQPDPSQVQPNGGLNDLKPEDIANPQIRALGNLLVTAAPGIDVDRVLGKAIDAEDPTLVDLSYLYSKFPAQAQQLAEVAKSIVSAVAAEGAATVQSVYAVAGGEHNWNAAIAAVNTHAPDHIRSAAKVLLNSKDPAQIRQGAQLVTDFAVSQGHVAQATTTLSGNAGRAAAPAGIDSTTFKEKLSKLDRNSRSFVDDRNYLFYERQLGKNKGLR